MTTTITENEKLTQPTFDPRELRSAFGQFVTGVTIATSRDLDGSLIGMTANSFSSVSMDPPLLMFCPASHLPSLPAFERAGHFAINILAASQGELAKHFARPSENKFAGVDYSSGIFGAPVINGSVATFECTLFASHDAGDHKILIGEIHDFVANPESRALVFHRGKMVTNHNERKSHE
ncbi:flavin reductase family protein [Nesterenkonia natronophila]|uniref:Flavin reductase n=1 Tax=Nesterenkonia natronophila TaxID=2174932 RepID=A0A3A4FBF7_9MICC|nr:flavin reductase family protein [Nesterenkonia natronophila]RJN32447.1 flavin reductase [Nesterenkonia natronophila]